MSEPQYNRRSSDEKIDSLIEKVGEISEHVLELKHEVIGVPNATPGLSSRVQVLEKKVEGLERIKYAMHVVWAGLLALFGIYTKLGNGKG